MANEKTLNTRVLLKTDTLANWNSSTLGLKKGEIAIATVAATAGSGLTEPVCMIKVGEDGVKKFSELPWSFYAKASDVYAWAKESTIFSSVVGTGNAFTDVVWDPALNGNKGGLKFTKGTTFATKSELDAAIEQFTGGIGSITDSNTITTVELITAEGDAHKGQIKVSVQKTVNGENDGAATVTYIDVVTPAELTETLKGYVTSVTADDDSIAIDNSDAQAPKVAVKLDPTAGNAIKLVSGKGLRAEDHNQTVRVGSVIFTPDADVNIVAGTNMGSVVGDSSAKTITINGKDWTQDITNAVNAVATAAMEFKGATSVIPMGDLRKGDTYKVSGSFTIPDTGDAEGKGFTAKVGDTIVYDGSKWYLIPSGDDIEDTWRPITGVDNDASLSFAPGAKLDVTVTNAGAITYSHETIDAPTGTLTASRNYINGITTDGYGHITGFTTHQETDQNLSNYKTKQAAVDEIGAADKTLKISQNVNGEITATTVDISIAHTQVNDWDANIGVKEIKADTGLKVVTSGSGLSAQVPQIAIDDAVTFIFDCGGAGA